ncbi:ABC transporter ATP-binding protein [Jannaschia pagri]|uniref:ABC transporter ATP-binding protein n=1 Tax=Jannaschia pagri TaxID=2829797 RepID=A0ABQ4NJW8_9RHOB|nr:MULTISPECIES: ABC transporter ATP-binding protein [unclassified Jannaschia]GIT90698.1 ABC transporter ATP-binding protein [Jannaschia sp. AI_61]GIT94530.1 ABC transporter ATP-binding protein [Jannaschia sp. AI_62]
MPDTPVLTLRDLSIDFPTPQGVVQAVKALSLTIQAGRRVGFIGESGSGKTTTALAIMRMLAEPGRVSNGTIDLAGTDVLALSEEEMRRTRLSRVAYIPQGAMNSLNPVMRVEPQMWDAVIAHEGALPRGTLKARSAAALASVGLPAHTGNLYPHELSGGMKQRVCIALGILLDPDLIIADEPTSALDVVTQRQVMQTLNDIQRKIGSGLILIGHDMGLMAQSVDELAVLKDGELVEHGTVAQIIDAPKHPYTQDLIRSVPLVGGESFLNPDRSAPAPRRSSREPLLRFDGVSKTYGTVTALHPMSFALQGDTPQIISIVGQSGSGKSTMGGVMLGFNPPTTGRVLYEGRDVYGMGAADSLDFRKNVQAVFQDPYGCFNPFYRVSHALSFPFRRFGLSEGKAHTQRAMEDACAAVGLDPDLVLPRYPHQLSGGQRQRLIVARALMLSPKLLIADEPVSMVDASLRATILSNIYDLKDKHGISILYITHDLATAYHVSDFVMVLYKGRVVEAGPPGQVIGDPRHPYTRLLIDSIPWPDLNRPWGSDDWTPEALEHEAQAAAAQFRGNVPGFDLQTE